MTLLTLLKATTGGSMGFRSSTAIASPGNGTSAVLTVPAGAAVDDIAVVGLYIESTAAVTPPSGFTQKADLQTSATARGRLVVFWKRLTAADSGSYTFTWSGSAWRGGVCGLWSGRVTSGDPFDGTVGTAESTTAVATLNVSTSPAAANGDAVGMWTNFNGGTSFSAPTNYTQRQNTNVICLETRDAVASGSTGNVSATSTISDFEKAFLGVLAVAASGTNAPADYAPGTGTAQDPTRAISTGSQASIGTGTANAPSPSIAGSSTTATATGAANTTTSQVKPGPLTATATGTANNATVSTGSATSASAGVASATGAAQAPSPKVSAGPTASTGTGTANNATVTISGATNAAAATATGTGVANQPAPKVAPSLTLASGTGAANNATVSTGSFTNAAAATATGTGTAQQASGKVSAGPSTATATGTANAPSTGSSVSAAAGVATAAGVANGATVTRAIGALAGVATATGTASSARWSLTATAQAAVGVATAFDVLISGAEANAESSAAVLALRGSATAVTERSPSISAVGSRTGSTPEVTD